MKIMVFENGEPGRRTDTLGENVQAELEELLGGPIVWESLTCRLHLVTRADAQAEELPALYGIYRSGRLQDRLQGNAVVVRIDRGGGAKDMTFGDEEIVRMLVRPL